MIMRIKFTKCTITISFLLILTIWYYSTQRTEDIVCYHSELDIQIIHQLTGRVHHVLTALNLTHFLCYASLWGQIRLSKVLPWESNTQFCIRNEELITIDEVYLKQFFDNHGLYIHYHSAEGIYDVADKRQQFHKVELYVFEEYQMIHMYRRIGWKRRVLPPTCEAKSLHCFPPRLIKPPLPVKEFGGYILPVPREGIELQKYHYEDNWWKDIKPEQCK